MASEKSSATMTLGIIFAVIALAALIALMMSLSSADDSSGTVNVLNATPTVDQVNIALTSGGANVDPMVLQTEGVTKFYIHGAASDNNGCEQIDTVTGGGGSSWEVKLFRTTATNGFGCTADANNCYDVPEDNADVTNCTAGGGDLTVDYEFDVDVQFYAEATDAGSQPDHAATDWTVEVQVTDDDSATGIGAITPELQTYKSLNVNNVNYGALNVGATSTEQTMVVTNKGNYNTLDIALSQAADWTCTIGTIPKGNVHWNTTSGQGYGSGTAVTGTDANINSDIAKSTNGTDSNYNVYMTLQLPANGVEGTCNSTLAVVFQ